MRPYQAVDEKTRVNDLHATLLDLPAAKIVDYATFLKTDTCR
jgi:hypothetical protein